jgi:hypothetical protein
MMFADNGIEQSIAEKLLRFGLSTHPLRDVRPSTAIDSARFNPVTLEATITFRNGQSYTYACSPEQWVDYRTSLSPGRAWHAIFHAG